MTGERLASAMKGAHTKLNQQKLRNPVNFNRSRGLLDSLQDPDEDEDEDESEEGSLKLWKLLPHLQGIPEAMLSKLPLSAMFHLNRALGKEQKNTAKLGINTRLAQNAQLLCRKPIQVPRGLDNRKDILHPARFLGGASCSNQELWSEAKRVLGEKGTTPLGNYDLDSIGCGGSVTPKGWQEIHHPGSQELKLKLFYLPNVAGSGMSAKKVNLEGGEEALSIGESMKEIADLDGYKMALYTAREAMASALPWNKSISAVQGLMLNTNYMQEDLGGNPRRASILTEFTDYVFGRNGLNWENNQPFLTTDDLSHVWNNWKGKRGAYFTAKYGDKQKKPESREKKQGSDVCRKFNTGDCANQKDKECKTPWGKTLKHVCNKYMPGGKFCMKDHSRKDH